MLKIQVPTGTRAWLAIGHTDMRLSYDGLALLVQEVLKCDPHRGHLSCEGRARPIGRHDRLSYMFVSAVILVADLTKAQAKGKLEAMQCSCRGAQRSAEIYGNL
jgi:hypothetical protein